MHNTKPSTVTTWIIKMKHMVSIKQISFRAGCEEANIIMIFCTNNKHGYTIRSSV